MPVAPGRPGGLHRADGSGPVVRLGRDHRQDRGRGAALAARDRVWLPPGDLRLCGRGDLPPGGGAFPRDRLAPGRRPAAGPGHLDRFAGRRTRPRGHDAAAPGHAGSRHAHGDQARRLPGTLVFAGEPRHRGLAASRDSLGQWPRHRRFAGQAGRGPGLRRRVGRPPGPRAGSCGRGRAPAHPRPGPRLAVHRGLGSRGVAQ